MNGTAHHYDELFDEVRQSCSKSAWSLGVQLARGGGVVAERDTSEEVVLRVAIAGKVVSPTVTLWPPEQDWRCDCKGDDPCAHVAAAIISLRRARREGKPLAGRGGDGGSAEQPAARDGAAAASAASSRASSAAGVRRVGYRFTRGRRGLELHRVLIGSEGEERLRGFLVQLCKQPGKRIAASSQDLTAELALDRHHQGWLSPPKMRRVLEALVGCNEVALDDRPVRVGEPRQALRAVVTDQGRGFCLQVERSVEGGELFANGALLAGDELCAVQPPELDEPQLQQLRRGRFVPPGMAGGLVGEMIPHLERSMPVAVRTTRLPRGRSEPPRLVLEVTRSGEQLVVLPTLRYGEMARIDAGKLVMLRDDGQVPLRDPDEERRLARRLARELDLTVGRPARYEGEQALQLAAQLERFRGGEIAGDAHRAFFVTEQLQPRIEIAERDAGRQPRGAFDRPLSAAGRLQLDVAFFANTSDGKAEVEAERVLQAWQQGRSLVALPGGGFAPLPDGWLREHGQQVADLLAAREADRTLRPGALPDLAQLCEDLDHPPPPELTRLAERLSDFSTLPPATLPGDLTARLRDYQKRGVDWLVFLRELQMGALLADDMGLGKTLQALCAIDGRTLIVAPTSVLHAWSEQLERFRPALSVNLYHGARRALDGSADVVLTSYGVLRQDREQLTAQRWSCAVLDEAQTIKNPQSQVAQAAYRLQASWRLVLTGTPVENRLEDLWSQLHFLNPGLLGGLSSFRERYAAPIAGGDERAARELRRRSGPFILRRLKQQVARELPPRTEVVLRCELSAQERAVYDAVRMATREQVVALLEQGGGVMRALELLLRLRQAACHPALVPGQRSDRSAKLALLCETLEQARAEGHRALVFSQWTALLDLVEPELRERDLEFVRLDGSTRDREAVVSRFQSGEIPVMLISLKAGGVGLTLTAADQVFLLDPWWNPATEDQAADRAHRIGQTRPVLIQRLVAEDTVEERILALQQTKRQLADAALADAASSAALTREDLLALLE